MAQSSGAHSLAPRRALLDAIAPRGMPRTHPSSLDLRTGQAAPFGPHRHRHVPGQDPGQPPRDTHRRLRATARREVGQPPSGGRGFVVDHVHHVPQRQLQSQHGAAGRALARHARAVALAPATTGTGRWRTSVTCPSVAPGPYRPPCRRTSPPSPGRPPPGGSRRPSPRRGRRGHQMTGPLGAGPAGAREPPIQVLYRAVSPRWRSSGRQSGPGALSHHLADRPGV